jgi:hypothetical protein
MVECMRLEREVAINNLVLLRDILESHSVKWWLTDGTLLGLYREGDFISHDTDTDIGIKWNSFTKECLIDILNHFQIKHIWGDIDDSFEITLFKDGVKTDLFFFYEKKDSIYHSAYMDFTGVDCLRIDYAYKSFDTKVVDFLGHQFNIPENPLDFILTKYGESWMIPEPNWHWGTSPKNAINTGIRVRYDISTNKFNEWLKL